MEFEHDGKYDFGYEFFADCSDANADSEIAKDKTNTPALSPLVLATVQDGTGDISVHQSAEVEQEGTCEPGFYQ